MNFKLDKFEIDRNLMFVIQTYVGHNTEDILVNLHEIVVSILTETLNKTRAARLQKTCKLFYNKTKIPIQINLWSRDFANYGPSETLPVTVDVKFPKNTLNASIQQLEELAAERLERNLGLRQDKTSLVHIEAPVVKVPKGLKGVL